MSHSTPDEQARRCIEKMLSNDHCSAWMGISLLDAGAGWAKTQMQVTENMTNGYRVCHGGVIFLFADTAFACTCNGYNRVTVAQGASVDFLRPVQLGDTLTASGVEKKRGKQTGVCDIEITNQHGALVALFRGKSYITDKPILSP